MTTLTTGKATEFIQFTRASNATVTDIDGKIKWAPHNLLTNSESFDASNWLKSAVTLSVNAVTAPNGTTTADTHTITSGAYSVLQGYNLAATLTYGLFAKAGTLTSFRMGAQASGNGYYVTFTLSGAGSASSATVVGTGGSVSGMTGTITALADGWYYCQVSYADTGGVNYITILNAASSGTITFWGAHLYRSDLGGMQANTSAYPMYNPTTPKNLLGYTEDFSNAAWSKPNVTVTVNSVLAPNGIQTADLLTENTVNAGHWAFQSVTTTANPFTASAYFKAGTRSWAFIRITDSGSVNRHVWFDLSSGSVGTTETGITASIVSVGDGWYRCRATIAAALAGSNSIVFAMSTGNGVSSYTGDGTSGIYIWGAQLSDSASLDTYSPVYGAAVTSAAYYGPRRDFDSAGVCRGLLVEEQRTNLFLQSDAFDTASWTKTATTITGNATSSPSGNSTADKIVEDTATGSHQMLQYPVTTAAAYNFSVYAKAAERNWVALGLTDSGSTLRIAYFNVSNGTLGTAGTGMTSSIVAVGNGWYRCSVTLSSAFAGSNVGRIYITTADNVTSYTGDGTSGLFVWGAQCELGSFATSYIPVGATTAGATRNADVASVSTQAFPYSATEGTIVVGYDRIGERRYSNLAKLSDASENNHITLLNYFVGQENAYSSTGGVVSPAVAGPASPALNVAAKFGHAFKSGDSAISLNGGSVTAISSSFTLAATGLYLGVSPVSGQHLNGHIRQITYLPRRISNTELQSRTQ